MVALSIPEVVVAESQLCVFATNPGFSLVIEAFIGEVDDVFAAILADKLSITTEIEVIE